MSIIPLGIYLLVAVLDWVSVAKSLKPLEYLAKPGAMIVLIAWMVSLGGLNPPAVWFSLGLVFSLAGDVFLMLPVEQFVAGLVAFLIAHLCYTVGYNTTPLPVNVVSAILLALVALVAIRLYRRIEKGLIAVGQGALRLPVLLYSLVISVMLFSALTTFLRSEWAPGAALLAGFGALLFFLSDSLLAWNKFVQPLRNGRLMVIITYHLGQALIAGGAMLNYLT
mgnify:CR=1 FL=1